MRPPLITMILSEFLMVAGNSKETGSHNFFCWAGNLNARTGTFNNGTVAIATDSTNIIVTSTAGVRVDDVLHVATEAADGPGQVAGGWPRGGQQLRRLLQASVELLRRVFGRLRGTQRQTERGSDADRRSTAHDHIVDRGGHGGHV